MAVFRVERNKGYTVMSNHHLRNKELTLKANGLLSQMLSLPENWDYTLAGLSHINRESIDAIRTAVWELEKAGYTRYGKRRTCTEEAEVRRPGLLHLQRGRKPVNEKRRIYHMAQKTGALIFDETADRYDIRFDIADYYGGLHCGECMDVFTGGKWKPTRIEYGDNWYLVGIRAEDLNGLRVRI